MTGQTLWNTQRNVYVKFFQPLQPVGGGVLGHARMDDGLQGITIGKSCVLECETWISDQVLAAQIAGKVVP